MGVVTLTPKKADADVVAALEAFLEIAKRGDMTHVVLIGAHADHTHTAYVGDPYSLIGLMEACKHEMLADD